ncbi:MAG: 5-formyltetrahydrofolate cyclo-ligase [Gammaproteobacteria bacterium]
MSSKAELRHSLRRHRQALSYEFRVSASLNIVNKLSKLPFFKEYQQIAVYLSNDNEVDVCPLFSIYAEKNYYLPMLTPSKQLLFSAYHLGDELQENHLGILEPKQPQLWAPENLDLVCVPLVGFDPQGHRLGMGGGYYDRTFAFKKEQESAGPFLLGIAYECQKVTLLPHVDWDIPLNGILTEQNYYPG